MDIASPLLAIPVVDIDGTMYVQLGIYLVLVFILGPLLFKPWLAALERRTAAVTGTLVKSVSMREEADALALDYDARLEVAREKAHGVRSEAHREEDAIQAGRLAGIREEANLQLAAERDRIASETQAAREALEGRVDELAGEITTKLLGRAS